MIDREQFLLDRKQGIGGSDVAAIMGLSPWKTPLGVYLDKVSDINRDNDNKHLKRGRRLERYILEEYSEEKNVNVQTDLPQFKDSIYPFLVGHVDGQVINSSNSKIYVEAKSYYGRLSDWQGKIPDYYLPQVAHYSSLTNADRVDVAVLAGNWEFGCFSYYRNKEYENKVRNAAIDFWQNHVLKNIPPKITTSDDAIRLYPQDDDSLKYASSEVDLQLEELAKLQTDRKNIEKQEELLKASIMDYMGSSSLLKSNIGYKISWRTQTQHRVNIELLKKQQPEIYNRFIHNINIRTFKLLKEKE